MSIWRVPTVRGAGSIDGSLLEKARDACNLVEGQAHTQHQSWTSRVDQHADTPVSTAYAHLLAYRSAQQGVHGKWEI